MSLLLHNEAPQVVFQPILRRNDGPFRRISGREAEGRTMPVGENPTWSHAGWGRTGKKRRECAFPYLSEARAYCPSAYTACLPPSSPPPGPGYGDTTEPGARLATIEQRLW